MPILAGRQRKQRTNAASVRPSQIYNAPGIYYPVFGRAKIYVSGHGTPGTSMVPGSTYTNPSVPGTYAGTNPSTPGNAAYNPPVPGNSGTNSPGGGNYAGSNSPAMVPQNVYVIMNYSRGDPTDYDSYRYLGPTDFAPYTLYALHTENYYNPAGGYMYQQLIMSQSPAPGNISYNPTNPGTAYTNNPTPGNVQYNPTTPGNPYTNAPQYIPSNTVTGTYVPGNYVPGNTNPASVQPGTYTPARYVPGNTVPGNTNAPVSIPGNPVAGYTNPSAYVPGNVVPGSYETMIAVGANSCPVGWKYEGMHDGYTYQTQGPFCSIETPPYANPGQVTPGNVVAPYTNPFTYQAGYTNPTVMNSSAYYPGGTSPPTYVSGYTNEGTTNPGTNNTYYQPARIIPGTSGTNPPTPGTVVYNPSTPGTAYNNNPIPGNTITVPPTPAQVGAPFVSLGVTFPGGPVSAPAPTVGDTLVEVTYTNAGVQVNVGPAGQVVIKETFV